MLSPLDAALNTALDASSTRGTTILFGEVTSVNAALGTIDVLMDGEYIRNIPYMNQPEVGTRAWLLHQDSMMVCIGPGSGPLPPGPEPDSPLIGYGVNAMLHLGRSDFNSITPEDNALYVVTPMLSDVDRNDLQEVAEAQAQPVLGFGVSKVANLSSAEFNVITKDPDAFYVVTDIANLYATRDQLTASDYVIGQGVTTIIALSKDVYDALASKDPKTLYLVS